MSMEDLDALEKGDGLYKFFKLESSVSTNNMVLFDQDGQLERLVVSSVAVGMVHCWCYRCCAAGAGASTVCGRRVRF